MNENPQPIAGSTAHPSEPSAPESTQGAAVRFGFPPVLFAGPLAAVLAAHYWLLPLPLPTGGPTTVIGAAITVGGIVFSLSGAATALRHRTTLAPHHRVSELVTSGPFRISRNPMYTGHAVALVGTALWVGSWWPLIVTPLCMAATYRLVISAEEEYLARRFGQAYQHYRARVRRWL
jgi:protein-S-isoprenylcysteine O-methyltransferase Ste14